MLRRILITATFSLLSSASLASAAPNGSPCAATSECDSAFCVDGLCCDAACTGQCEACNLVGSEGICAAAVGIPRGDRLPCDDKPADACDHRSCDGVARDQCASFANGGAVACGEAICTSPAQITARGRCDGEGGCVNASPTSCAPYACDASAETGCRTTCSTADDCAPGFSCSGGACVGSASACTPDGLTLVTPDGVRRDCAPYRCVGGACVTGCVHGRDTDCMNGFVCRRDGICVDPATLRADDDSGGCAIGGKAAGTTGVLMLLSLALLGGRRQFGRRGRV